MRRCSLHPTALLGCIPALVSVGCALAADAATRPAVAKPLDPKVEAILDRQEARGKDLEDIACDLEYIKEDVVLEDKQTLKGRLRFKKAEPNPLFYIEFDSHKQDGVTKPQKEWHVFDGRWYIEARESTRTINKHEVLRPGEKKEVFKLGEGPFPVPFGQKKADIIETFDIKLVKPGPDDPSDTDHLECTPRPGTDIAKRYGTVHFWIDRKKDLPVKMSTVQEEEGQSITAIFMDPKINTGFAGSELNLPAKLDYKVTEDPLPPLEPSPTPTKK